MELDTAKVRQLLDKRDQLDAEIVALVARGWTEKKPIKCGTCGDEGHSARTCSKKPQQPQ